MFKPEAYHYFDAAELAQEAAVELITQEKYVIIVRLHQFEVSLCRHGRVTYLIKVKTKTGRDTGVVGTTYTEKNVIDQILDRLDYVNANIDAILEKAAKKRGLI